MSQKQKLAWSRLDNAAKIFPSTSEKTDTRVFRFSCELFEKIDPALLQQSLDISLESFPSYLCVMKKGAFWYYLEQCDLESKVSMEQDPICSKIYDEDERTLLFKVTYFKNRINLEMYHVLSDGTGAMQFLKTIVYHYLIKKYENTFSGEPPALDNDASLAQKSSDGFRKYYQKNKNIKKTKLVRAFNLKGEKRDEDYLQVIEGIVSSKSVLEAAHKYNTTLTVFLTSVFIQAIHQEMSLQNELRPVVLMIPVNLRQFFPSETAKNFFGLINVKYNFKKQPGTFENIIQTVDSCFKSELIKERLALRMNSLAALEHNPFVRIAPLPLKNVVLKLARRINDKHETAVISNVGKIKMPEELNKYIRQFGVLASTLKLQLCLCSFADHLQLGFTSSFVSTDIQKNFFRFLSENGIEVEIRCNDFDKNEVE